MKVFYNPCYDGFVYFDFSKNNVAFDTVVCNTKLLVSLLELHAGLYTPLSSDLDRTLDYYYAIKAFSKENPGHMFAASFDRDAINTAKECLKWRDSMLLAGWVPGVNDASARMKTLAAIEKHFDSPSFGEKLLRITRALQNGCALPDDLQIIVPFDYNCFMPAERELLKAIGLERVHVNADAGGGDNFLARMARVLKENSSEPLTLADNDGSVEIVEFESQSEALQYLSQVPADAYDVWINRDNRSFDNWLSYLGKPTCGAYDKGVSQISQLPLIGLGLFSRPLNLNSLLSWLSVPLSPLSRGFRNNLINAIVGVGGYFNQACRDCLDSAPEYDKERIKYFLPDITKPEEAIRGDEKIQKSQIVEYVGQLSKWILGRLQDENLNENQQLELKGALQTCNAMKRILDIFEQDQITFEELILVFDSLSTEIEISISDAQTGCANLIKSSANFAGAAGSTVWCDFYNPDQPVLTYDFLLPSEKQALGELLWQPEQEREFNRLNKYLPFLFTKQKLTLVTVKKCGTTDTVPEPLIIRLDKIDSYVKHLGLADIKGIKTKVLPQIQNRGQSPQGTVEFERTDLVQLRQTESFSAISDLIDNPFDYVFDKIIHLHQQGAAALSEVYTTKGTVAHAIIQELFGPASEGKTMAPAQIKKQIDERYFRVFDQKVLEKGGILLQTENLSETAIFKEQMHECVKSLVTLLQENDLEVVACEQEHSEVALEDFKQQKITFNGSIDMVLQTRDGEPVIFDFKYAPKEDKYLDWIGNNRSMQLALYKGLVHKATGKQAKAAAYVLLPEVKVITADNLKGAIFSTAVKKERAGNLLAEMANSYDFRKAQILDGIVEDGEGMVFTYSDTIENSPLDYVARMEKEKLVPMDLEIHTRLKTWAKKGNQYSNYSIFKAGE